MSEIVITSTIVIEIRRYDKPVSYGFNTYMPDPAWYVYPLGEDGPAYSRRSLLYGEAASENERQMMRNIGYVRFDADEVPQALKDFIVRQVIPLQWKSQPWSWIAERTQVWIEP